MPKERLQWKRYKRAIKKAKCTTKIKSIFKSIYFIFTGTGNFKGFRKNIKNILSNKPFYRIETIRCDDYNHDFNYKKGRLKITN